MLLLSQCRCASPPPFLSPRPNGELLKSTEKTLFVRTGGSLNWSCFLKAFVGGTRQSRHDRTESICFAYSTESSFPQNAARLNAVAPFLLRDSSSAPPSSTSTRARSAVLTARAVCGGRCFSRKRNTEGKGRARKQTTDKTTQYQYQYPQNVAGAEVEEPGTQQMEGGREGGLVRTRARGDTTKHTLGRKGLS